MSGVEPLSTARIAAATASGKDLWLSDSDGRRGFGRLMLRVQSNGAKHFYFRISKCGSRKVVPLGPYAKDSRANHLTLNQARAAAQQVLADLLNGTQAPQPSSSPLSQAAQTPLASTPRNAPQAQAQARAASSAPDSQPSDGTLDKLCAAYVDQLTRDGKYSAAETGHRFRRHLYGTELGQTHAAHVTAKAIAAHLRAMVEAKKGRTAAQLRSSMGSAFALALKGEMDPSISADYSHFGVTGNPALQTGSMAKFSKPRRRKLTPSELGCLLAMLDSAIKNSTHTRLSDRFIRISLLLGGQRCEQLARVTTADVDCDNWMIRILDPKGRREVPREHYVPISSFARDEIQWLLGYARDVESPHLFPGKNSPCKPMNNAVVIGRVQKLSHQLNQQHGIPPFGYSDFRRTTQTQMTALGIIEDVSNQILSHGLGGLVKRHYNSYEYEAEMREALEKWGAFLLSLKSPPPRI